MDKVISRSEEALDGRNLLIKDAKSFAGRPEEKKARYQVKSTPIGNKSKHGGGRMTAADDKANVEMKTELRPQVPRQVDGIKIEKGGWQRKKEASARHKRKRSGLIEEI